MPIIICYFCSVSLEEVKSSLSCLGKDKSPGPDGFPSYFFQETWDFVGQELWQVVEESRRKKFAFKDLNNTFLALIPKKGERETFSDFRPIALYNTMHKVISKVIANRLKLVLPTIISSEQSGFALGK